MTSPTTIPEIQSTIIDPAVTAAVDTARALVNISPPGAVQSGIDFDALNSADLLFLQVVGDVTNVFAQMWFDLITEALAAASLVAAIVGDVEGGIAAGTGIAAVSK